MTRGKQLIASGVASALVLWGMAGPVRAGIVFNNGGPDLSNGSGLRQWVEADDFQLSNGATLTGAEFWTLETGPWDGTLQWSLFNDAGGTPGAAPLAQGNGTAISKTATGNTQPLTGATEFRYDFALDNPAALAAGTYWFGLHLANDFSNAGETVFWETTSAGFGASSQQSAGGSFTNWSSNSHELAFNLSGTPAAVPEPSTLALFSLAVAGWGIPATWRKRRARRTAL